jgi:hypothetical protein
MEIDGSRPFGKRFVPTEAIHNRGTQSSTLIECGSLTLIRAAEQKRVVLGIEMANPELN